jgi:DeoR family transcriptional regulator, ulaG and ulaABCDEF operon transcriptional repressor
MTESQRHNALLNLLHHSRAITVEKVIDTFGISPATARRDINKLKEQGKLTKVRNGAEAKPQARMFWSPMNIHQASNHDEKTRIAHYAAQLCHSGDSVLINCGSTAFLLGQKICGSDVLVITNYFPLIRYLITQEHDDVVIIGGEYHRTRGLMLAPHQEIGHGYAAHYMFTSGKGLTADGLYKMDILAAMSEQKMMNQATKLVVLVDSSKVGQRVGMLFAPTAQIDIVITGRNAPHDVVGALEAQGVQVVLV